MSGYVRICQTCTKSRGNSDIAGHGGRYGALSAQTIPNRTLGANMYADDIRMQIVPVGLFTRIKLSWIMWRIGAMGIKQSIRTFFFN